MSKNINSDSREVLELTKHELEIKLINLEARLKAVKARQGVPPGDLTERYLKRKITQVEKMLQAYN